MGTDWLHRQDLQGPAGAVASEMLDKRVQVRASSGTPHTRLLVARRSTDRLPERGRMPSTMPTGRLGPTSNRLRRCPTFTGGRPPRSKGQHSSADPPTVEEIIAVMHAGGEDHHVIRWRGLIAVLRRAGLRMRATILNVPTLLYINRQLRMWRGTGFRRGSGETGDRLVFGS